MAEDRIELVLDIKARGASGVTNEVKKLEGSFADVEAELKRLSSVGSGFGNTTRQQISALRTALAQLQAQAQAAGKSLGTIEGRGIGTKSPKLIATEKSIGDDLAAQRKALQDQKILHAQALAEDREFEAQKAAIKRKANQEQVALGNLFNKDIKNAEKANKQAQAASGAQITGLAGTAGFIGLNVTKSLGSILDPVKAKGLIAPQISEIAGAIGDIFGSTFGDVFGKIGSSVGKFIEALFDTIGAVFRAGIKLVAGIFQGLFISLISSTITGPIGLVLGLFGGLVTGIVEAFSSLLKDVVDIVGNLLGAITSLISAGLKIVGSIFQGVVGFITDLWHGFWTGLKDVAEFSMKAIQDVAGVALDQFTKGFIDFIEAEKLATKSFDNIADTAKNFSGGIAGGIRATDALSDSLRTQFGLTNQVVQTGLYDILSSQFRTLGEAQGISAAAAKLATVTQSDFGLATKATVTSLSAFGFAAGDADAVAGKLYNTVRLGRTTFDQLGEGFSATAVLASQAGVDFNEFLGSVASITVPGLSAKQAMTGIQRILQALTEPTSQNAKEIKKLGLETKDAEGHLRPFADIITDIVKLNPDNLRKLLGPIQGIRAFEALRNNVEGFKKTIDTIRNDSSTFDKAFAATNKQFFQMLNIVEQIGGVIRKNLAGGFGEVFRKPLENVIPLLQQLQQVLTGDNIKKFFGEFVTFVQPIMDELINPLMEGLRTIIAVVKTGDFSSIFKNANVVAFRDAMVEVIRDIKQLPSALGVTYDNFVKVKNIAGDLYNKYIQPMVDTLKDPKSLSLFISGLDNIIGKAIRIKDIIVNSFNDPTLFKINSEILLGGVVKAISKIGSFLLDVLTDAFDTASRYFVIAIGARLKDTITSSLHGLFGGIAKSEDEKSKEGGAAGIVHDTLSSVFGGLSSAFAPNVKNDKVQEDTTSDKFGKFLKDNFKGDKTDSIETKQYLGSLASAILTEIGNTGGHVAGEKGKSIEDVYDAFKKLKNGDVKGVSPDILSALSKVLQEDLSTIGAGYLKDPKLLDAITSLTSEIRIYSDQQRAINALGASGGVGGFADRTSQRTKDLIPQLKDISSDIVSGIKQNNPGESPTGFLNPNIEEIIKTVKPPMTDWNVPDTSSKNDKYGKYQGYDPSYTGPSNYEKDYARRHPDLDKAIPSGPDGANTLKDIHESIKTQTQVLQRILDKSSSGGVSQQGVNIGGVFVPQPIGVGDVNAEN